MSCEQDSITLLRQAGYKLTPQRLMVLSVVRHAPGHLTANTIFEQVKQQYPYVDISTVYRTMGMLTELRLVNETNLGSGDTTFEWVTPTPHHHLICRGCGAIDQLDDASTERFSSEIEQRYGFRAELDHLPIFGHCRACRAKAAGSA